MKKLILIVCIIIVGYCHAQNMSTTGNAEQKFLKAPVEIKGTNTVTPTTRNAPATTKQPVIDLVGAAGLNFSDVAKGASTGLGLNGQFGNILTCFTINTGGNLDSKTQNTLSSLFFPDNSNSDLSLSINYFDYVGKDKKKNGGYDQNNYFAIGPRLFADLDGKSLTGADSAVRELSTYELGLGLFCKRLFNDQNSKNSIKITAGIDFNIVGLNSGIQNNQSADSLNFNIFQKGLIRGSDYYFVITINQVNFYVRAYNAWGNPSFVKNYGSVIFTFGIQASPNLVHVIGSSSSTSN